MVLVGLVERLVQIFDGNRHPIRSVERIALVFSPDDVSYPDVLALRADFPRVPHINLRVDEFPRAGWIDRQALPALRTLEFDLCAIGNYLVHPSRERLVGAQTPGVKKFQAPCPRSTTPPLPSRALATRPIPAI